MKKEKTVNLENSNSDLRLRSLPPPQTLEDLKKAWFMGRFASSSMFAKSGINRKRGSKKGSGSRRNMFGKEEHGEHEAIREPLRISIDGGRYHLRNMTLRAAKPQFFNTLSSETGTAALPPLKLFMDATRLEVSEWPIPSQFKDVEEAWLILESGTRALRIQGQKITGIEAKKQDSQSPIVQEILEFMNHLKKPAPLLALITPLKGDSNRFIAANEYTTLGKKITLIGVHETLPAGKVVIPPERMRLISDYLSKRQPKIQGYWVAGDDMGMSDTLGFLALPPVGYFHVKPRMLTLQLDLVSKGSNVVIGFQLLPWRGKGKGKAFRLDPKKQVYRLDCRKLDMTQFQHPADGMMRLAMKVKVKQRINDPVARKRLNHWQMRSLSLKLEGEMPATIKGSL